MQLLTSKPLIDRVQNELKDEAHAILKKIKRAPRLVVVLVGENPASQIYVKKKKEFADSVGIQGDVVLFPTDVNPNAVRDLIFKLNQDPTVDGILIQRPLPSSFIENEVLTWVSPLKDVDAFHPETVGKLALGIPSFLPCTPAGVLSLLDFYKLDVSKKICCIVGRSNIVGKPLGLLLLQRDATVILSHSKTQKLQDITSTADFLFVAIGRPHFINDNHIKNGAVVIDVGISKDQTGKVVGDVDFEKIKNKASAITPVPGGVGPMTILHLMKNTLNSAQKKYN